MIEALGWTAIFGLIGVVALMAAVLILDYMGKI
jgi:hypothetical protein